MQKTITYIKQNPLHLFAVEQAYEARVAAVFPHSDELMELASAGIFSLHVPDHPITATYRQLTDILMQ